MKGRSLLALMVLLLAVSPAWGQIAFDATSNSGAQGSTNPVTWSHTVSGSDTLLAVHIAQRGSGFPAAGGVTYNGVSLTSAQQDGPISFIHSSIWYLANPATGTNTVSVTFPSAPTRSVSGAVSLTGVDQSSPLDANNGSTGTGTTASVAVTTVADNAWVIGGVGVRTAASETITVGAGETQDWNVLDTANGLRAGGSHTTAAVTPAGAHTMDWTISASLAWAISAASFKPAAGAARRLMVIQ